jgi:unsaturated rhamnogalacturonyl hydrolase
MEMHARDAKTGLLHHAWDEKKEQTWADPATGLSAIFWGRAMGWYAIALVDVLDYLPVEHSGRNELITMLQRLAEAVAEVQDDSTGVWWQVMDQPDRAGNYLEASVSCMFVYALTKGVRLGYLDKKYQAIAEKAYHGILKEFIYQNADGTIDLNHICSSAGLGYGRNGSYEYYVYQEKIASNDGKGVGPFITASLEMEMKAKP